MKITEPMVWFAIGACVTWMSLLVGWVGGKR